MSQTILIVENDDRGRMLALNLNIFLGTDVIFKNDFNEALPLIKIHPSIDLVICQTIMKNENVAEQFNQYIKNENKKIPLIFLGECPLKETGIHVIPLETEVKDFMDLAARLLGVAPTEGLEKNLPELFAVPMKTVMKLDLAICDIYLRVRRDKSEDRYIKRFRSGDPISKGAIVRYIGYGQSELFISSQNRVEFAQALNKTVLTKLVSKNLSTDERIQVNEEAMQLATENVTTDGINAETINIINASIDSLSESVKDFPGLGPLLQNLLDNKAGYLYKHCQISLYICHYMMTKVKWSSPGHLQKIGLAVFFHDILLTDEKLALIRSEEQLSHQKFSSSEKSIVLKHAQLAADLVKKFPTEHLDVEMVIRQHHGSFNGYGFVDKFPANLSPLAMVFVIAEEFTDRYLVEHENFDRSKVIADLKPRIKAERYHQIIDTLETLPL